jgi:lamin tail-like protein
MDPETRLRGWTSAFLIPCTLFGLNLGGAAAEGSAVINEIHFAASLSAAVELRYEYVEIYNSGPTTLALDGWRLSDLSSSNAFETIFTFPAFSLPSGCFAVVYAAAAAGSLAEDSDCSDGRAVLIAATWTAFLANAGDAVALDNGFPYFELRDFVYYDEANTGDPSVDDAAVAVGIWKDGAAIDTLSSATSVGRAIALRVDGAAPNEVNVALDAEDLDWQQYPAAVGGTPGRPNVAPSDLIFVDGFEPASAA